jgi:hypothetical protein
MSILVLTSDTLIATPAAGNIEYNGQFYGTDSALSRAQMQRITQGTAVTCAGQTSIDFTSLPAWVKKITVLFNGVSTSGTSGMVIQIGSGSFTTTGYNGACSTTAGAQNAFSSTVGFLVENNMAAANNHYGIVTLATLGSNIWAESGNVFPNASATTGCVSGGTLVLSGTLDRVRITTQNGTDTFDTTPSAGSINILYEG